MFYYYGRKKRLASRYPVPLLPIIVEPFAGSAAYSLHGENWRKKVLLVEKDPAVAALWRWFIHEATEKDIRDLPDPVLGVRTDHFLHILHSASKRAFEYKNYKATPMMMCAWAASKLAMQRDLHKIKHWEVIEGDYTLAPDIEATWFIDPPYQGDAGTGYRFGSSLLDYQDLGAWCKSRKGQVLVCEGAGADWLPFEPFVTQKGAAGKVNHEVLWQSNPSSNPITDLFGS